MPTDPILIPDPSPERRVFTNRTLNMRSIKAIGYDMDYTLTQYHAEAWEERAFAHARERLAALGWPVEHLEFDASVVSRGLVMDLDQGNLLKATRFGWVIRAMHGTRFLDYQELRRTYSGTLVDLSDDRYVFMNTLFSLSEASLFAQGADLLDAGKLPSGVGYNELFVAVRAAVDGSHRDGVLKEDVLADPERFISLDGDIVCQPSRSAACGEAPDAHHKLGVVVRERDDDLHLRSLPVGRANMAGSLRNGDRLSRKAGLLHFFELRCTRSSMRRARLAPTTFRIDRKGRHLLRRQRPPGRGVPRAVGRPDPLRRRPPLRRRALLEGASPVEDRTHLCRNSSRRFERSKDSFRANGGWAS